MGENYIRSICWDITSRCNESCKFCYRNPDNCELSLEENKDILKKLIDFGVDKISFVGGEPLLYKDLFELVEWGKNYAHGKTCFSITTNTILLTKVVDNKLQIDTEIMEKVVELFDWICLSLDGSNEIVQERMGRNSLHFSRIMLLLHYFDVNNYQRKLKINTVVSIINKDNIEVIYDLITSFNVKRWKLFRFLPSRGSALKNKNSYFISSEDFRKTVERVIDLNEKEKKLKISVNGYDEFDNSYVTISSEGKLVIYNGGQYENVVDLKKEDISEIIKYIHIKIRFDFLDV